MQTEWHMCHHNRMQCKSQHSSIIACVILSLLSSLPCGCLGVDSKTKNKNVLEHVELYVWSLSTILWSSSILSWELHGSLLYHLWKRCLWFKKLQIDGDESLHMLQSTLLPFETMHVSPDLSQLFKETAVRVWDVCAVLPGLGNGFRNAGASTLPLQIFFPRRLSKKTEWLLVLAWHQWLGII